MSNPSPMIYWIALAGTAGLTLGLVPILKSLCRRAGLVDMPGDRKIHDRSVALAGGLAILSGGLVAFGCGWLCLRLGWFGGDLEPVFRGLEARSREWLSLLNGALAMTLVGVVDDRFDLRPAEKFSGQLVVAVLVVAAGVRFPGLLPGSAWNFALTILWILTVTNAFNFTDNMNGLCAGLAVIGAAAVGGWSAAHGQADAAVVSFLLAGAALGFLVFNYPRASAFLGDSGSHLLGFALAVLTILAPAGVPKLSTSGRMLLPLLVLAVPLTDLIAVVVFRLWHGKPVYVGDTNHFSHRLVRAGLNPVRAVALLWLIAAIVASVIFWI